jgi:N6-adenosine-specific RNA methylase IME4
MNYTATASAAALQAEAKVRAYQEAKRGIADGLEWADATADVLRGILQGYCAANGAGPVSHVLQEAIEHQGKSQRALERARARRSRPLRTRPVSSALTIPKQARRARLEAELGARILALPVKQYGVGLADPGWRFEPYSRVNGMDRAADNHYATSSLEAIKALDVSSFMAPNSVMFLWSTVPMIMKAGEVLEAWGFTYKSQFAWPKTRAGGSLALGTGYWNRNAHELLLVGTRGKIPAPAPGTQWPSVIFAPVGRHSEKPAIFHEMIESYYPTVPKIELFARTARAGWDRWGLEAPQLGSVL